MNRNDSPTAVEMAAEFVRLPVRMLIAGMTAMTQTFRSVQRQTQQNVGVVAGGLSPPAPTAPFAGAAPSPSTTWTQSGLPSPETEGAAWRGAGNPFPKEERKMSGYNCSCGTQPCSCGDNRGPCNPIHCDQDVGSDCCVKVVQYFIVTAAQWHEGNRILVGPKSIAFSEDMTQDGFISWVIAENAEDPKIKAIKPADRRHLRVPYCVTARFPVAGADLQQEQVAILADIAHTIKEGNKPAKK